MRHRQGLRKLNRTSSHRLAMLRNMCNSLITHEAIKTTVPKAKELRMAVEPLITLAKEDTLANKRLAFNRTRDRDVVGKLFGDKGYIGQKMAQELLRRGLALMTRVRKNMQSLPVSFFDKALLNGRNIAETIIGHIKEFSSLRLPKHRSVFNAFTHITAAIIAYQINPLPPQPIRAFVP